MRRSWIGWASVAALVAVVAVSVADRIYLVGLLAPSLARGPLPEPRKLHALDTSLPRLWELIVAIPSFAGLWYFLWDRYKRRRG